MAYGKKYSTTFQQLKSYSTSGEWQINIYLEGYGGAVTEIDTVKDSIKLVRDGDFADAIRPTTLEFSVYNKTEGQFLEFADATWGDYKVELIFDPNGTPITKYIGYNQTEIYTEPMEQTPYPSALKFTDGLKHLEYVRFDNSGTLYTGQKALIETLRLALNKLPSPIGVRDIVNVYEDSINSTTSDSMLAQIYTDSEMYKKVVREGGNETEEALMCNEVIEEILKPLYSQIYQSNGVWYIVRKQEYKGANLVYRDFNANVGTESTLTVAASGTLSHLRTITNANSVSTDVIMPSASAEKEILQPVNRLKVTYNQQNLDYEESNLIKNGNFTSFYQDATYLQSGGNSGIPNFWSYTGIDTSTYFALINNFYGTGIYGFQFNPATYKTSTAYDSTKYISQSKTSVPISTADTIRLSYNSRVVIKRDEVVLGAGVASTAFNNWIDNNITITNEVYLKLGTYYLAGDNQNGYSWNTTAQNAKIIMVGSNNIAVGQTGIGEFVHYYNNEFSVDLPNLPTSALVSFDYRFYETYTDVPSYDASDSDYDVSIDDIYYTNIDAIYLPDEVEPETQTIIYAEINEDENVEEIDVIHGDGGSTISQGSFRLNGGVITDLWTRRGIVETLPILKILVNSIRDDNGGFKDQLNAKLIGEFEAYNSFTMTIGAITKTYILDSFTNNIETNEHEVTLIEVVTFVAPVTLTPYVTGGTRTDNTTTPIGSDTGTPQGTNNTYSITSPTTTNYTSSTPVSANQTNLTNFN